MSSLVPEGWEETRLGNVSNIYSGGTPSRSDASNYKGEIPWVKSGEVNQRTIRDTSETISERALTSSSTKWVEKGSVLVAMYGATAGKVAKLMIRATINQAIAAISAMPAKVSNDYLFHEIEFKSSKLLESVQGSGQPNLSGQLVKELKVSVPPLPEQKKIASILTSVDEVIENIQKKIDKLQDLKKATMNDLLTKGIGHTEFKDSELGRIPVGWEVATIGDITSFVTSGSRGWSQYYSLTGSLFIRIGNLTREHINLKFDDVQLVDPPKGGEGTRTKVELGDILVSITADLGVIGVVNESLGDAYVNQHVCLARLESQQEVISRWVGHFLNAHEGQEQFSRKNDGGAKAGLNLPTIRSIVIPIPTIKEQHQIVRTLDQLDSVVVVKKKKLAQTQSLKKSLMQDLLTGKVRVTVN